MLPPIHSQEFIDTLPLYHFKHLVNKLKVIIMFYFGKINY